MYFTDKGDNLIVVEADQSRSGFGVVSTGSEGDYSGFLNYGSIIEDSPDTSDEAIFINLFSDGFDIDNYGEISKDGAAIGAYESHVNLYNQGDIFGGIYLRTTSLNLVNEGCLEGAILLLEEFGSVPDPMTIENTGRIASDSSYATIVASRTRDIVENSGEIVGDIYTRGGRDWVFNDDGVIDGNVWLEHGDDIYRAVDGSVTGTVLGQDGHDTLTGGSQDDRLSGGIGRDEIDGGAGDDHLLGGRHYDVLTGGAGLDVFEFLRGYGGDHITDFENNRDTLLFDEGIWGGGLTPAQLLERYASTDGDITTIDFGGRDVITLDGIDDYRVLANDIAFAL